MKIAEVKRLCETTRRMATLRKWVLAIQMVLADRSAGEIASATGWSERTWLTVRGVRDFQRCLAYAKDKWLRKALDAAATAEAARPAEPHPETLADYRKSLDDAVKYG